MGHPVSICYPPVSRLAFHLKDEQQVLFDDGGENRAVEKAERNGTPLLAYFDLVKTERDYIMSHRELPTPSALDLRYVDLPIYYALKKPKNGKIHWKRRKYSNNQNVIPRLYTVSPGCGEKYFLRMLLLRVCGATSYDDLRTFQGVTYSTFKAACIARGLLQDDQEWIECLQEAVNLQYSNQRIRHLFAVILAHNEPKDVLVLWNTFKFDLSDDLRYHRNPRARRPNSADMLTAINIIDSMIISMTSETKTLRSLKVPELQLGTEDLLFEKFNDYEVIVEQEAINFSISYQNFNDDQRNIFLEIDNELQKLKNSVLPGTYSYSNMYCILKFNLI